MTHARRASRAGAARDRIEAGDRTEASDRFACFGSSCSVFVAGDGEERTAREAVALARRELQAWHVRFSRFLAHSEPSVLNADPRRTVPVSPLMARLAHAVHVAGHRSRGLVDATLLDELETAGYALDYAALGQPIALERALELAPARKPATARGARAGWSRLEVDLERGTVARPRGLRIDSGGIAKGLFADVLAQRLACHASFAVVCAGDLAIGGSAAPAREVRVESPFEKSTLHTFRVRRCGVATSGIGRRSWLGADGSPAHHLLDPSTGLPAFTGVVQVTALATSALEAEVRAKAALLSGPENAPSWLADGGVIVLDDGSHLVAKASPGISEAPAARAA